MKIGFHLPISKGFRGTLNEAEKLGCEVVQIFLKNPRSWTQKTWKEEEVEHFRVLKKKIPVVGHLTYLPNLARIDEDRRNLDGFLHETGLAEKLGIEKLVIHLGSRNDTKKGIMMTARAINTVLEKKNLQILLENSAGQRNSIGKNIDELAAVYERIIRKEKIALCVDTAHLFESGYDIRTNKAMTTFFQDIEKKLGKDKIGFFHLNDSKTPLGSRTDRHWHIGQGKIGLRPFRYLMNNKHFAHLYGVMETPKMGKMDKENMNTMRSLLSPLVSRPFS